MLYGLDISFLRSHAKEHSQPTAASNDAKFYCYRMFMLNVLKCVEHKFKVIVEAYIGHSPLQQCEKHGIWILHYYTALRFVPQPCSLRRTYFYSWITHTQTPKPVQRFITQFFSFSYWYNEIETIFLYYYFSRLHSTRKLRWNNGDNNKYYKKMRKSLLFR